MQYDPDGWGGGDQIQNGHGGCLTDYDDLWWVVTSPCDATEPKQKWVWTAMGDW